MCQSKTELKEWFFQINLEAAVWYLKIRLCLITGGKICISGSLNIVLSKQLFAFVNDMRQEYF